MPEQPRIVCVVPTVRPERHAEFVKAWTPLFEKHKVTLVTVWDGDEPHIETSEEPSVRLRAFANPILEELRHLFCRRTDAVRNIGFVYAARFLNSTHVLTLDDDVHPPENPHHEYYVYNADEDWSYDPIQAHLDVLNKRVPLGWMNTAQGDDPYLRGFPYQIRDEAPVMLSHGVWVGTPDFDGETQLRLEACPDCRGTGVYVEESPVHGDRCVRCSGTGKAALPPTLRYYEGPIPRGVKFPLCFVPTAEVTMADGSRKPISDIKVGERVFAKGGESHPVLRTIENYHSGVVVKLRVAGRDRDIVCTENHPLWVLRDGRDDPEWVVASAVTLDDKLATPIIREPGELTDPNISTCKLLGYFLAEGNYDKYSPNAPHPKAGQYHGLQFTFGTEKKQEAIQDCCECLKNLGVGYRLEHPKRSATVVVSGTCYDLVALLRDTYFVGEWSHGKRLPLGVYRWSVPSKRALLAAYWAGDGCFSTIERVRGTTQYQCQAKTRSRTMAVQIQLLLQSLGFPASVARLSPYKQSKEAWAVSLNGTRAREFRAFLDGGPVPETGKRKHDKSFSDGRFVYYSVKGISVVKYEGPVYNLTVEDDHSYLVEGVAVKNCGMNVMVRAEALPYLYFAPMGPDCGVTRTEYVNRTGRTINKGEFVTADMVEDRKVPVLHRFADIYMGLFLKDRFDELGWVCYTGGSTIHHTRASDARVNFEQEKLGREWLELMDDPTKTQPPELTKYLRSYADKRARYEALIKSLLEKSS